MERYISFNLDDESDGDEEVGRLNCWTEILNSPIFLFRSFSIFLLSHIFMLNGNKIWMSRKSYFCGFTFLRSCESLGSIMKFS